MQDFQPTLTGMLKNVRSKKSTFKKLHMVSFILGELEKLQGGVAGLLHGLIRAVPVCNFLCDANFSMADGGNRQLLVPISRRGREPPGQHGGSIPQDNFAFLVIIALILSRRISTNPRLPSFVLVQHHIGVMIRVGRSFIYRASMRDTIGNREAYNA